MTTTVYGTIFSPAVRAVLLTADCINHKVEFKEVDLFRGQHLKPAYLKLNPLHTVPTIVDNGYILFDSFAIVTYLVDKYAQDDTLYPKDLQIRGTINQRLFFGMMLFNALKEWSAPFVPGNDGIMKPQLVKLLQSQFNNLETLLGENDWVAATKEPTVADICILCIMDSAKIYAEHEITSRPKVNAWFQRMQSWTEINTSLYPKIADDAITSILRKLESARRAKI